MTKTEQLKKIFQSIGIHASAIAIVLTMVGLSLALTALAYVIIVKLFIYFWSLI